MKATQNNSGDIRINVKIKLSALWTSVMFCYIYGDYFELYVPKKVDGLISGQNVLDNPMKLFAAALVMTIPASMIFLSVMLNLKTNRILQLVFGTIYTAMMLLIAVASLTEWYTFYVYFAIVESIITSIIVWQAWTWKN